MWGRVFQPVIVVDMADMGPKKEVLNTPNTSIEGIAFDLPAPMILSELQQEVRDFPVISYRTCVVSCAISRSGVVRFCLPYVVINALNMTRRILVFGIKHMRTA